MFCLLFHSLFHTIFINKSLVMENSTFTFMRLSLGVGTLLYQVYRYVPPQRVWFLSRFGVKTGIDFQHFGLKLGMLIGGTFTKAINLFFFPATGASNWRERKRNR